MKVSDMNWSQMEAYLKTNDLAIVPIASTEQHAYLSLSTDSILAEKVSVEAAEPYGVPVFPVLAYGITPSFRAYPGTVSLRIDTYMAVMRDILDSLAGYGFKRILLVNGHGGNLPVGNLILEWMGDHPGVQVKLHNWWNASKTMAKVKEIDPLASHASWMENFPWTRIEGVAQPQEQRPLVDFTRMRLLGPAELKEYLGDGNFGGYYEKSDEDMLAVWEAGVAETREVLEGPWS